MPRSRGLSAKSIARPRGSGNFHSEDLPPIEKRIGRQGLMLSRDCQETVVGMAPTLELRRPSKFKYPLQFFRSEQRLRNPVGCCIYKKKEQLVNERKKMG